jgi:hypothetical protein
MAWRLSFLSSRQRRWLAIVVAVAVVGLAYVVRQQPRFGESQFRQLTEGMSEAEVVSTLGCPAGDYRPAVWSRPDWFVAPSDAIGFLLAQRGQSLDQLRELERRDVEDWVRAGKPVSSAPARLVRKRWWGRGFGIEVVLDDGGRSIHSSLWVLSPPRPPPDLARKIRWWFGF